MNESFIKNSFRGVKYDVTDDWKLKREILDSYFPDEGTIAKYTLNRYREYMGLEPMAGDEANREVDFVLYFEKNSDDKWEKRQCDRGSVFNGTSCVTVDTVPSQPTTEQASPWSRVFESPHLHDEEVAEGAEASTIGYMRLVLGRGRIMNIDTNAKRSHYTFDANFYANIQGSLVVHFDEEKKMWALEQIKNKKNLSLLRLPFKLFVDIDMEIDYPQPIIVHNNSVCEMNKSFYELIYKRTFRHSFSFINAEDKKINVLHATNLLPHLRLYRFKRTVQQREIEECVIACFAGNIMFDCCIPKTLLSHWAPDKHAFPAHLTTTTKYPQVVGDYNLDVRSFEAIKDINGKKHDFVYFSTFDMYDHHNQHEKIKFERWRGSKNNENLQKNSQKNLK